MRRINRRLIRMRGWHLRVPAHESKLAYCGNVLIENRDGLVVDTVVVVCSGTPEGEAALEMLGGSRVRSVSRWAPTRAMTRTDL